MVRGGQGNVCDQDELRVLCKQIDPLERLNAQPRDSEERLQILCSHMLPAATLPQ
jgi:hypothetical protein